MSGVWKPGDVGISTSAERFIVTARGQCYWPGEEPGDTLGVSGVPADTDRPLVVIDPEDAEQIKRLVTLFNQTGTPLGKVFNERLTIALREFANPTPPKPEEPTGLGAVVEDDKGRRWTNTHEVLAWRPQDGRPRRYTDISAVRVLSEGVTP